MISVDSDVKLCRWRINKDDAPLFRMLLHRIFDDGSIAIIEESNDAWTEFVAWATNSEMLGVSRIFIDAGFKFYDPEEE